MKFYSIIFNNSKQSLVFLFSIFSVIALQAQNASNSPYSRFGIGDLQTTQNPRNLAIGGLSVALTGLQDISSNNPASYMNLDSLSVQFDVSFQATYSKLREKQSNSETVSANTNSASLGQMSFAFPITSWLKSSFGLTPNSNMSYSVLREERGNRDLGDHFLSNNGDGGLNQAFIGFALGTRRVSVGVNANYTFGSFTRNAVLYFNDSILYSPTQTYIIKSLTASGLSFDIGLQYTQPLSKNYQLGFGLTYSPSHKLDATQSVEYLSVFSSTFIDTISPGDPEDGTLKMPDTYTFGLSFEKINRWVVGIEYSAINFKNYEEKFGGVVKEDPHLGNAYTLRAGLELKGQRLDNNFLNRLSYRVGYNYGTNYIIFENSKITQYGVSFGLGMPVRRGFSKVDIGVEIGRKGRAEDGQIQENYGRIVIGISAFDRWFIRGKFD